MDRVGCLPGGLKSFGQLICEQEIRQFRVTVSFLRAVVPIAREVIELYPIVIGKHLVCGA